MIEIVEYREDWPEEFERIARRLRSALGDLALRIDHIGSTAVPGLAAKDVIDVQITVADFTDELTDRLRSLGYQPLLEPVFDHIPPGFTGSPTEWEKRYARAPEGSRPTNTHIRVAGRANQAFPLIFRDYLREHPLMAEAYGRLKRRLAAEFDETMTYAEVKDPAVDLVWLAAQEEIRRQEERPDQEER